MTGYPRCMHRRMTIAAVTLGLAAAALTAPSSYAARPPGHAEQAGPNHWTEADKAGFGTSRSRDSRVWFTLEGGRVSEVFYPDLSTPSVRSLELTVTDGGAVDRQASDMTTVVTRPDERSLRFTQVSTDNDGHYRLTEEIVTDPARSSLLIHASVQSLDGGVHTLGVRYEPALGNGSDGDRIGSTKRALKAVDQRARMASAVVSS